jgi:CelD/BcsL family acetyltransferase involved in cellulose biosynthesis
MSLPEVEEHRALSAPLWRQWRALWERCPRATAFQSAEWLESWCTHLLAGEPCVLVLRRGGALVGLAPFFVWSDGGRRVLSLMGAGVSDYQDLLVADGEEPGCLQALAGWLAGRRGWDRVEWTELPDGSPLRRVPLDGLAGAEAVQDVCPGLPIAPGGQPAARPQMLQQVGQLRRRAERAAGVTIEAAEDRGTAEAMLADLERWHLQRWPGSAFANPRVRAFHRGAVGPLLARGGLMLLAVRLAGVRAAVVYGFHDHAATRLYLGAFDPAAGKLSPGVLAVAQGVACAAARGSRLFDFLRGAEPYKYRWGARDLTTLHRRVVDSEKSNASPCPPYQTTRSPR